jgi:hypothetical protein
MTIAEYQMENSDTWSITFPLVNTIISAIYVVGIIIIRKGKKYRCMNTLALVKISVCRIAMGSNDEAVKDSEVWSGVANVFFALGHWIAYGLYTSQKESPESSVKRLFTFANYSHRMGPFSTAARLAVPDRFWFGCRTYCHCCI